jgi:hypothetical protein
VTAPKLLQVDAVLAEPLAEPRRADRAVGYVGLDIPEDILAVPGLVTAHLPWERDRETPWADRWLEDGFPGWARSILEDWHEGRFDFFEAVVFSRGDDAAQRLYYYVCELQRQQRIHGPVPLVFDVAYIPRASSLEWTRKALASLAAALNLGAADIDEGISAANRRRAALIDWEANVALPGHVRERIARASLFAAADRLEIRTGQRQADCRGKVLLAGSVPPDDALHVAVESAGWNVAADAHARSLQRLGPRVKTGADDPLLAVAEQLHRNPRGPRGFNDRAEDVTSAATRHSVDAVIIWLHDEDEAAAWDVVSMRATLSARDLPCLVMDRRAWDLSDDPETDIAAFLAQVAP